MRNTELRNRYFVKLSESEASHFSGAKPTTVPVQLKENNLKTPRQLVVFIPIKVKTTQSAYGQMAPREMNLNQDLIRRTRLSNFKNIARVII